MKTNPNDKSFAEKDFLIMPAMLMIISSVWSLIMFVTSIQALQGIFTWYPQFVAQTWFIYDELFASFTFLGLLFGFVSAGLMLSNRYSIAPLIVGILCTISGAGVTTASLIAPLALLWRTVLYCFLPSFLLPFVGTLLFSAITHE